MSCAAVIEESGTMLAQFHPEVEQRLLEYYSKEDFEEVQRALAIPLAYTSIRVPADVDIPDALRVL